MHGATHDWLVLNTIKNGLEMPTGEEHLGGPIKNYMLKDYAYDSLTEQRKFKKILDVGSLDVNGTMRTYDFLHPGHPTWLSLVSTPETQYIGIDIMAGPSVDYIMNAHDMSFKDNFFDLVMCVNMLEHDDNALATLKEIWRVTEVGGLILLLIPNELVPDHHELGGGSEHYNKFDTGMVNGLLKDAGFNEYTCIRTYHDHLVKAIKQ